MATSPQHLHVSAINFYPIVTLVSTLEPKNPEAASEEAWRSLRRQFLYQIGAVVEFA